MVIESKPPSIAPPSIVTTTTQMTQAGRQGRQAIERKVGPIARWLLPSLGGQTVRALDSVSLRIEEGELVAITGSLDDYGLSWPKRRRGGFTATPS